MWLSGTRPKSGLPAVRLTLLFRMEKSPPLHDQGVNAARNIEEVVQKLVCGSVEKQLVRAGTSAP